MRVATPDLRGLLVGPDNAPLNFNVYPFVEDKDTYAIYLDSTSIQLQTVVRGEITNKGRKLAITIPLELRQPNGLDATLTVFGHGEPRTDPLSEAVAQARDRGLT